MEQIVYANTNANFLNKVFGTNYKGWMRGRWEYDKDTWVWMIRLDGKVRQDWRNRKISENEIWEEYIGSETPTYRKEPERKYRIVVGIEEGSQGREYHILGKYKFDSEKSFVGRNVLIKVCDIHNIINTLTPQNI